uniref:Uncharacterized protein n=1 Tax=Anguilla anguilla TaxID=7936 RepID=A0A0E9WB61_ANGAN
MLLAPMTMKVPVSSMSVTVVLWSDFTTNTVPCIHTTDTSRSGLVFRCPSLFIVHSIFPFGPKCTLPSLS